MILAAGRGERMRPLTDHTPKPLLTVGDYPLIVWHLKRLKQAGIHEVVINHAWLGQQIEAMLGNGANYGMHIRYSAEGGQGLETAGGIATALPLLGDQPFLVINGDVLTNINFQAASNIALSLDGQNKLAHLWLVPNPKHHPNGDFNFDTHHSLSCTQSKQSVRVTFSGVGVYHPQLFAYTPPHQPAKLAPLLHTAIEKQQITGQLHTGLWLDVGTPERLAQANQLAKQGCLNINSLN